MPCSHLEFSSLTHLLSPVIFLVPFSDPGQEGFSDTPCDCVLVTGMVLHCVSVLVSELNLSPLVCAPCHGNLLLATETRDLQWSHPTNLQLCGIEFSLLPTSWMLSSVCLLISDGESPFAHPAFPTPLVLCIACPDANHWPIGPLSTCVAISFWFCGRTSTQHLEPGYLPGCVSFGEQFWFQDSAPSQTSGSSAGNPILMYDPYVPRNHIALLLVLW